MSESNLSPEELHNLELEIPAFKRKHKIEERKRVKTMLKSNPGGVRSSMDPINPQNLKGYGEPTKPVSSAEITLPSKN